MKRLLIVAFSALILASCNREPKFYGEEFDTSNAITVNELMNRMETHPEIQTVVTGTISSSCQAEGCWLNLENPGGQEVYVDWDHKFNLPKRISGETVILNGYAYIDSSGDGKVIAFKASGVKL